MVTEDEIIDKYGKKYADGEYIFKQGDHGEEMFIINRGNVNIALKTNEGEKVVATLGAGDFFGEMAVIDKGPRSASAKAQGETVCIVLNEEMFEQQMQRNAKIVKKILKNLSARLRGMNDQLKMLTEKDYTMRVVSALLFHVSKSGDNSTMAVSALVQATGMEEQRAKLEEILSAMAKAKVISLSDDTITVSNAGNIEKYKQYLEMKKAFGEM